MNQETEEEALYSSLTEEEKDELVYKQQALRNAKVELGKDIDARKRYDYEWMVRELFLRGYHFNKYQPTAQTVVVSSRQPAKIPINIVAAQVRSIRNQATSFKPKWEVLPRYATQDSQTQARYSGMYLDYFYDINHLKAKIKDTITQGLTFSVGIWEILHNKLEKQMKIALLDPFDFYIDRYAEEADLSDAIRVVKATRQPIQDIKNNPDFDEYALHEIRGNDNKIAVSEYKQFLIQATKIIDQGYATEDSQALILYEGYFKIYDDNRKKKMRKMVWTDQNFTPLVFEEYDEQYFPFSVYRCDMLPKNIYGESWMKNTMVTNRIIDNLESSVYEYNMRVAKGRFVIDNNSGVRAIHNVHGEIITKNRGSDVRAMDMPPLPVAVSAQIERMRVYQEDIGAVHDASMGRMPVGIRSGVGVAELKQSDSTGQADIVDNLEDFLSDVAFKILRGVSKNITNYQFVQALGVREGEEKNFVVIGSHAPDSKREGNKDNKGFIKLGPDWLKLVNIADDNNIRVTVGSWLGYTKDALQEKVLKFAETGLIDQKTALRLLEFGQIDEIVKQTRIEQLLKSNLQKPQQPDGQPGEEDQYGLAMSENEMMVLEGHDMPVQPHDDHIVHIAIHQEALGQGADELVNKHITIHKSYLGQPLPMTPQDNQKLIQPQGTPQIPQQGGQPMPQAQPPVPPQGQMPTQTPQMQPPQ